MATKDFLIGAIQARTPSPAGAAHPCSGDFDVQALDRHVESVTARCLTACDRAGRKGLDLVLTGEDLQGVANLIPLPGEGDFLRRYAHPVPGPLCERLAAVARRHGMHLGACLFERAGGRYYNTCVLFDAKGRIAGKYRKVHLPPQEACVLTPGRGFPVFRTALGKVGMMICYDMMFPEAARCLALHGADLVLHPTAGYGWTGRIGDIQAASRALDNDLNLLIACPHRSGVINRWGERLADGGDRKDALVCARLDPREPRRFAPGHFHREATGFAEVRQGLFRERQPKAYRTLTAAAPPILADSRRPAELHTPRRKAMIRRLIAKAVETRITGAPAPYHWTAREDGKE